MTLLGGSDIEAGWKALKRSLDKSGLRRELEIRSYPKPSERKRQKTLKARLARMKRRKKERIVESRDSINQQSPSWKFIYRDGEYRKVVASREEMRQI